MSAEKGGGHSKEFRERWEPRGEVTLDGVLLGIHVTDLMGLVISRLDGVEPDDRRDRKGLAADAVKERI